MAVLYEKRGRYDEAESLFQRALAVFESKFGPDQSITATGLNGLAALYDSIGRYDEAEPLYLRALAIREAKLGLNHPDTANILTNLAWLYYSIGRYDEAESLYLRALTIQKAQFGAGHPDTAGILKNLAVLYWAQEKLQSAFNHLNQGLTVEETILSRNLVAGSDANKHKYLATVSGTIDLAISLHLNDLSTRTEAAKLALTTILQRKGRILDIFTKLRNQLADDATSLALWDDLKAASTRLSSLKDTPPLDISIEEYTVQLNRLHAQVDTLEAQLSQHSAEFADLTTSPRLADIQASLPTGTALVELIRYRPVDPSALREDLHIPSHYAAFLPFHSRPLSSASVA